jgi:hypothetical protein
MEAERARVTTVRHGDPGAADPEGLGGIEDQSQAVQVSNGLQNLDVSYSAEEMHGNDCAGLRGDSPLDQRRQDAILPATMR